MKISTLDDHRVAVWLPAERASQQSMLAAHGWRLFSVDEVVELSKLLEVALSDDATKGSLV